MPDLHSRPLIRSLLSRAHLLSRRYQLILDGLILTGAFLLSYLIRFEFEFPPKQVTTLLAQWPLVVLIQCLVLYFTGAYSFIWRYTGMAEIRVFIKAGFWSGGLLLVLRFLLPAALQEWRVPISVILLDTFLAVSGALGLRVMRRWVFENYEKMRTSLVGSQIVQKPALLVGAGRGGALALKELSARGDLGLNILGFVDDSPHKQGMRI